MAKGEIARFEQFLLLSQCFQKASAAQASESVYMRERDKVLNAFHMLCSLTFFSKLFAKKLEKMFETDSTNGDCPENASSLFRFVLF